MIIIIREPATPAQISEMEQAFGDMIKLAVDVERIEAIVRHLLEID